jgi:hypothetical protein
LVGLIASGSPLDWSKENSRDLFGDVLLAKLPALLSFGLGIWRDVTPKKGIFAGHRSL